MTPKNPESHARQIVWAIDAGRTKRRPKMKTHEFSIIAPGLDPQAEDFESRLYDAGCDDATIAFQKGHIIVDLRERQMRWKTQSRPLLKP
jgi:hypothetical protein